MKEIDRNLYIVLLAGGKSKRLWPLAEGQTPKQFLDIIAQDTFLNHTIRRSLCLVRPENIYIVSLKKYSKRIFLSMDQFKIPRKNLLIEPEPKNTAPAALLAASVICKKNSESVLLFSACDQLVMDQRNFRVDSQRAVKACRMGKVVSFGLKPTRPETEYGYMKISSQSKVRVSKFSFFKIHQFIEKPEEQHAAKLFRRKNYYWSSGLFMMEARIFLSEYKKYASDCYHDFVNQGKKSFHLRNIYKKIQPISLEKLIIQKTTRLVLIKANFKWQDLGQWDLIYEALKKDKKKNIIKGDVSLFEVKKSLVLGLQKKIVCLGLEDVVIVDSKAGLLVADKKYLHKLKEIL